MKIRSAMQKRFDTSARYMQFEPLACHVRNRAINCLIS